tara:strand:+ start:296 stop:691 length:396 start_codon:yes stop_codon:yes gene_type:complete
MKPKILIVTSRYYKDFSENLESHCKNVLDNKSKYKLISVPGIFEIPVVISKYINKYDGFIALGCVIKGETPHFDFISKSATDAIMNLSVHYKKPIGNGIITCLNKNQALVRSRKKGQESANAVLEVLNIFK